MGNPLSEYQNNIFLPFLDPDNDASLIIRDGALPETSAEYDAVFLQGHYADLRDKYFFSDRKTISGLLDLVSDGGKVYIADYNQLGLRFFSGWPEAYDKIFFDGIEGYPGADSPLTLSKKNWEQLLDGFGDIQYRFYYPYPDHVFTLQIFSDSRLPQHGDLNVNRLSTEDKCLALFEEERVWDRLIENDLFPQFANAFLICIEKRDSSVSVQDTLSYVKFSSHRADSFSLFTSMYQRPDGQIYFTKQPEKEAAKKHLAAIREAAARLGELYPADALRINPIAKQDEGQLEFACAGGKNYEELVDDILKQQGAAQTEQSIRAFIALVCPAKKTVPFADTPAFDQIFQKTQEDSRLLDGMEALPFADIDCLMENVICTENGYELIDYEWTFDFPVPVKFIIFRILHYYFNTSSMRDQSICRRMLDSFAITPEEEDLFSRMETAFQSYISGSRDSFQDIYEQTAENRIAVVGDEGLVRADENVAGGAANPYQKRASLQDYILSQRSAVAMEPLEDAPTLTVLVCGEEGMYFDQCISTIDNQSYQHFNLVTAHDLNAANQAIELSADDYMIIVNGNDSVDENALYEIARYLSGNAGKDFLYSDEDWFESGNPAFSDPFYKPDWSPDTLWSMSYASHLCVFRRSLLQKAGGFREEIVRQNDWENGLDDMVLRIAMSLERDRIGHIPEILCHRRRETAPSSAAVGKRIREEALAQQGIAARVEILEDISQFRIIYDLSEHPLVSIVIPSKDNAAVLKCCLSSIWKYTTYPHYEIIIVDNGSQAETRKKLEQLAVAHGMTYLYAPMEFNFSRMCNMGAEKATGEYLLFLNDDIEIMQPDWLDIMAGQASMKHTGAVGVKLYYPNTDRIQHIGVLNIKDGPAHAFLKMHDQEPFYYFRNRLSYNWLAVTAACLMVSRKKYLQAGGFEEALKVAYNDVDFCFKLYEHGYYNVCRSDVQLYHHESLSRGFDGASQEKIQRLSRERKLLFRRHQQLQGRDPFYNKNLSQISLDFSVPLDSEALANINTRFLKKLPRRYSGSDFYIDKVIPGEMVLLQGWISRGDTKKDDEAAVHIIFRTQKGRLLSVEAVKMTRTDVEAVLVSDSIKVGFACAVPAKDICGVNRIGALFVNGETAFTWSNFFLQAEKDGSAKLCDPAKDTPAYAADEKIYQKGKRLYRIKSAASRMRKDSFYYIRKALGRP